MKAKEADSIMKFLGSCPGFLSNHEMVVLCEGLLIANDDSSDDAKNAVLWNAVGHLDEVFKKDFSRD